MRVVSAVAYLGYGGHGTYHEHHFDQDAKKIFIYNFLNLCFATPTSYCNAASTQRPHLRQGKLRQKQTNKQSSITRKLSYRDTTRWSDIVAGQGRSLAISTNQFCQLACFYARVLKFGILLRWLT